MLVGGGGLIQPAQVRPPESTLFGTGNVVRSVGDGMMQAVISHPAGGMAGAVEHSKKDQRLLDKFIGLQSAMGQHAVIANRGAKSAQSSKEQSESEHLQAGQREQDDADDRQNVNRDEVRKNTFFSVDRLPKRAIPRPCLLRCQNLHVFSADLF